MLKRALLVLANLARNRKLRMAKERAKAFADTNADLLMVDGDRRLVVDVNIVHGRDEAAAVFKFLWEFVLRKLKILYNTSGLLAALCDLAPNHLIGNLVSSFFVDRKSTSVIV